MTRIYSRDREQFRQASRRQPPWFWEILNRRKAV